MAGHGGLTRRLQSLVVLAVILPMTLLIFVCYYAWIQLLEYRIQAVVTAQVEVTRVVLESDIKPYVDFLARETPGSWANYESVYRELSRHPSKPVVAVFYNDGRPFFSTFPLPPGYWVLDWGMSRILDLRPVGSLATLGERVTFGGGRTSSLTLAMRKQTQDSRGQMTIAVFLFLDEIVARVERSGVPIHLILTDAYDRVLFSDDDSFVDQFGKLFLQNENGSRQDHLEIEGHLASLGLKIYGITSLAEIRQAERLGTWIVLAIAVLGIGFFLGLSRILVHRQTRPIETILQSMEQFSRGNFSTRIQVHSQDEFELIGKRFNELLDLLDATISKLVVETAAAKDAELKQLEAFFNPHFLYNTLDSVAWMLRFHRNTEATETVMGLASLLRYSVGRTTEGQSVTIRQDVFFLKQYMGVMKNCLEGELAFVFRIARGLDDWPIPKLIAQPLLENSIKHGKIDGQVLKVVVSYGRDPRDRDWLMLSVSDNGRGFPQPTERSELGGGDPLGFGLDSILRRLSLSYGESFRFSLKSRPRRGTSIRLFLKGPMKNKEVVWPPS